MSPACLAVPRPLRASVLERWSPVAGADRRLPYSCGSRRGTPFDANSEGALPASNTRGTPGASLPQPRGPCTHSDPCLPRHVSPRPARGLAGRGDSLHRGCAVPTHPLPAASCLSQPRMPFITAAHVKTPCMATSP